MCAKVTRHNYFSSRVAPCINIHMCIDPHRKITSGSQDYQECFWTQSSTTGCNTQENPLQKEKAKDSVSLAAAECSNEIKLTYKSQCSLHTKP